MISDLTVSEAQNGLLSIYFDIVVTYDFIYNLSPFKKVYIESNVIVNKVFVEF